MNSYVIIASDRCVPEYSKTYIFVLRSEQMNRAMQIQYTQYLIDYVGDSFCSTLIFASFEVSIIRDAGLQRGSLLGVQKLIPAPKTLSGSFVVVKIQYIAIHIMDVVIHLKASE